jgi:5'(3')-deoxyribonucleotidase
MNESEKVALFDLDGTLADYHSALKDDLEKIRSPYEPEIENIDFDRAPPHLEARRHLITSQPGWWRRLEKFQLGWNVLEMTSEIGFSHVILTKGPVRKPSAWSEKVEWVTEHSHECSPLHGTGIIITLDKGLVYGRVLVDDYPDYVERWLQWRPRGLVIMPAQPWNETFMHPSVVRYTGSNDSEVNSRLKEAFER